MNILFINYYDNLNADNLLFDQKNADIGDDLLRPFQALREQAVKQGIKVGTRAVITLEDADIIVFVDLPDATNPYVQQIINTNKPLYLIVLESIHVRPVAGNPDLLRSFKKIFTYDDSMVDDVRIIKLNYAFDLPRKIESKYCLKEKLCVTIAGNKTSSHPQELYSEREKAIRWFEKNHPDDFDLYGFGWNKKYASGKFSIRTLGCLRFIRCFMKTYYPSYCGTVVRKKPVLDRYKFAICYENVRDVPGYITEKIFDCFFAGCIPIYLGADNVSDYIPPECFIDKRNFMTYEKLYDYLISIDETTFCRYLNNIENYLRSDQAYPFSIKCFVKTLLDHIIDLDGAKY